MKLARVRFAALLLVLGLCGMLTCLPSSNAQTQREQQLITITANLSNADGADLGDLITVLRSGEISSISFKSPRRYRGFAIIDRTQLSQVNCSVADSEFGDTYTAAGSWIAVVKCPRFSTSTGFDVPTLIGVRADSTAPTGSMECWENTELGLGVCYSIQNETAPRTKEHILLGRPVS